MSEQRLSLSLSEIERAISALRAAARAGGVEAAADDALAERLTHLVDVARRSGSV